MKCDYCELVNPAVIFEDDKCIAVVKDMAATPGHVSLIPKKHHTILEFVPDDEIKHLFRIANKLSIALFDTLGIHGTNIIVQNGVSAGQTVPHFSIDIIPRKEGDGLNFEWKPKQLLEEEMDTAFLQLKEEGDNLIIGKPKQEVLKDKKTEVVVEKEGEDNYMIKQLRRVP